MGKPYSVWPPHRWTNDRLLRQIGYVMLLGATVAYGGTLTLLYQRHNADEPSAQSARAKPHGPAKSNRKGDATRVAAPDSPAAPGAGSTQP